MRLTGRSSLALVLGFVGILALASVGAADSHSKGKGHAHHGDCHPWGGDGGGGTFGLGDFNGTYADSFQGNAGGGVWVIGNGLLTSDGAGNVTGSIVINDSVGNFCPGSISGTYTVNGDGTGGLNVNYTPAATGTVGTCNPLTQTAAIVIFSEHRINVAQTNTGFAVLGNLVRQKGPDGHDDGGDD